MKKCPVRSALASLLLLLAGCATAPPALHVVPPDGGLAILQLHTSASDEQLRRSLHADQKQVSAEQFSTDRIAVDQAIGAALIEAAGRSGDPLLASADFIPVEADWQGMAIGQTPDAVSLASLRAQHPAGAYLRVRVTDYGQTPESWKSAYITFEVVSTLTIGGLLYVYKAARPLAGAYLLEEGIEEYSQGYAGWWLINRLSRPVRVEADLIDGRSGAVLWRDSDTGMAGWTWGHLWHMDDATRRTLLQTATDRAADQLIVEVGGPQSPE